MRKNPLRCRAVGGLCFCLALAALRSISSLSDRTGLDRTGEGAGGVRGGPAAIRSRSELTGIGSQRAVEVIFFTPLRWARVEHPTGSRTGGTFLFRAE